MMYLKNKKNITVLLLTASLTAIAGAAVIKKGSWGDKKSEGIRESTGTELYNPARYAFDRDEQTYWAALEGETLVWAEQYKENEEDIKGASVKADLCEGSKICFCYEKNGVWIPFENGMIKGPVNGKTEIEFTEEQRKSKKILVQFTSAEPGTDRIYEIELQKKDNSRKWGKIEPESYSFNQKEYINLKPSRLWDGYIKETWYEPLWYVPYEIQQTKEYKSGIFASYNGNPGKEGEIIWELDGKYRVDFIKVYCDEGWRDIAFEFWDGESWKGKKELKNSSKKGWNRLETKNTLETERIRITFPGGWENARFINQIEIWGEGERKNDVRNILFTKASEKNEYTATIERAEGCTELELITEGGGKEAVTVYLNGNEYTLQNAEFKSDKENVYRITIKDEDKRNGFQFLKIQTGNDKLKNIFVQENFRDKGRIITQNHYSDRYKGYREGADVKEYEKTITLDRKYEIERVIVYTHNGSGLRIRRSSRYGSYDYIELQNEGKGEWKADLKGKECSVLNIISDCEFEIDEAEIYGSPLEDKGCAVEIWSSENADGSSCITGWKGSRESKITIDGTINPRQEGCLFWMPVKEINGNYLGKEKHTVRCTEGNCITDKKYYVNPSDDTKELLNEIKKTPLLLTIDIPYGEIFTQSEEIDISGRYGNGNNISVYVNGEETESENGTYRKTVLITEGENTITVSAQDITGRKAEKYLKINRDSIQPEIEIIHPAEGEYINSGKAEFCIDGKEDRELWWQFNDEAWERGNGKIKYKDYYLEDGFYTYTVRAQDRSGNISEDAVVSFCMDAAAPEQFSIEMNVSGWTNNTQPQAMFTTYDVTSGVDHYEYKIDEGSWKTCESPLTVEKLDDGIRHLYVRAIDKAGNIREESADLYIDTSVPPEPEHARPVSSDTSIILKWKGPDDNSIVNEKLVAREGNRSYRIERNPQWNDGEKLLRNYGYGELFFEDTEVEVGKSYSYRISSIDRAGNESQMTEWKSAITALAVSEISDDSDTIVEYDGMTVTLPKGAAAEDIVKIQIHRIKDEDLEEVPENPLAGSTYMITAVRQKAGELYVTSHADLTIPAVIEISYKPSLIPEHYLNSEIAPYYYDDIWGCWMRMPESFINTEKHTVTFRSEHFTEFNIQATKKVVLTEAELREGVHKLTGKNIGPAGVRVSGEDGGLSYEFTEYIMPGKGDMSLPVQRVYTTSKAYADAAEKEEKSLLSLNHKNIDGESVWSIADGWKISMPYMKINGDSIVLSGLNGQCFTSGQMKKVREWCEPIKDSVNEEKGDSVAEENKDKVTEEKYFLLMESNEYSDVRVEFSFIKKMKTDWLSFFLTGINWKSYAVYNFMGAKLYQSDGKRIVFNREGRVTEIEDCTENQKIQFDYEGNEIKVTDTLGNTISFVRKDNRISKITAGSSTIEYSTTDDKLTEAKDTGGRVWNYDYSEETIESKSELLNPPAGYKQSEPKTYKIPALTGIKGKGYGHTKIEYDVKKDLKYTDIVQTNTYEITQEKLYVRKKTEGLSDENNLRTTDYTVEYGGPIAKQFYVKKSIADDGQTKTETVYSTVLKTRDRLSNAPEALRKNWKEEKQTGEQEKENRQLLTYAGIITTFTDGVVQIVTNEIEPSLMRFTKVTTKKAEGNLIKDEYEYYKNDKDYNGNVIKESHEYITDGKTSGIVTEREYCESVNNRTNLVRKMTKKAYGIVNGEDKTNTVEEEYEYNQYGQMVSRKSGDNIWDYSYYEENNNVQKRNGLLKSETSPEKCVTEYSYDYSGEYEFDVTITRKSDNPEETDSITESKSYYKHSGKTKSETDGDGNVTSYEYDALGRMTSQEKNNGAAKVFVEYDDENLTTKVTDELGCSTLNTFDGLGRLTKVSKSGEVQTITVLLEYDGYDRVIKMSEPFYDKGETDINKTNHSSYEYDRLGRIKKLTDADGRVTVYTYVDSLNMTETNRGGLEKSRVYKDNLGNIIRKKNWIKENEWTDSEAWYDGEGKILCSKDENKNLTFTKYNAMGLVDSVIYPDGLTETRSYNKDGILNGVSEEQDSRILAKEVYILDACGRIKEKKTYTEPENENGKKVVERYEYNNRSYVTENAVSYEGDVLAAPVITKEYDWAGNITEQKDGEGNIISYEYDLKGNLIKLTDPRETAEDENGKRKYTGEFFMQMEYDKFGRLVRGWIPHEKKRYDFSTQSTQPDVLIEYDAQGNVIKRTDYTGDAANSVVTDYKYTKAGLLESETCGKLVTKYEYDNAGRLIKTTDSNGVVSNRSYDGSGRLLRENLEGENTSSCYEYYPTGTIKSKIDRNGNITTYEYDTMNRLVKEDTEGLIIKTYGWDGLGRKLWENDGENNLRRYEYDGLGRLVKETDPDGRELLYKYDARGNVTEYIDGRKTKFVREYTKTGLLKEDSAYSLQADNDYLDTPDVKRSYAYDEAGCLIKACDTNVTVAYNQLSGKYESDAYGNIRSMKWDKTQLEMKYDYDLLGRTTGVTTPDGKTVNYTYDKNGLLTAMDGFIKGSIKYETDKARIKSYTLENGAGKVLEKTLTYDSLGNISSMEYSAENKKTGFSYLYDNNYNITTRTALDTGKTSWFTYDAVNRLIQSQMHGAFETREQLDNGRLYQIERDLDGTKDAEMYFDALPENITLDTAARSFVYDFERDVSVNRIELFPDAYTHRVRERDIRLYCRESEGSDWKEIKNWKFTKNEKNGSLAFAFKEAVNARQIKLRCTWDDRNFLNVSIDSKSTFRGNPQNLLRIWILEENRFEDYEYDGNSSRIKITENGTERLYQYYTNKENGNTARVLSDGKWWYTYDANGNRTVKGHNKNPYSKEVTIDETKEYWTYTWDLWNRLVKVEQHNAPDNAENVCVEYTYDVLNHRIQRVSRTKSVVETTQYAYGRNGAITYQKKTTGNTVTSRSYAYLNNQITGFTDKEGDKESVYYTVTDIQGSVTEIYDENNSLVWKSGYTAFGIKAGETTGILDFDGLYTGCDYDVETGLTYHWNRWRSEDGDSWLSEDFTRDGANWYGYAVQNPINYVDTNGLTTIDDYYYQKTIDAKNQEEKNAYIQQQTQSWEANMGYSEYTDGTPNQPLIDPGHSASEQYDFLKQYYSRYKDAKGKVKGLAAKNLRAQIRNAKRFDLKGLFSIDESFMNNELRDFLNLNENGTMEYDLNELLAASNKKGSGWKELSSMFSMYHQTNAGWRLNAKFVNEDGREVIIDKNGKVITKYNKDGNFNIDYGTFNYADPDKDKANHKRYDVTPFENQYKGQYTLRYYVRDLGSLIPSLRPNSYYWNQEFVFIQGL